jgi:hypothetical protein
VFAGIHVFSHLSIEFGKAGSKDTTNLQGTPVPMYKTKVGDTRPTPPGLETRLYLLVLRDPVQQEL